LKRLRAVNADGADAATKNEFWRGMKDLQVSSDFMTQGGTEPGCMSTSTEKDVVAQYSLSANPLVFRVTSYGFMDFGASISWLSVYPKEKEILYPPLTYLKYVKTTPIEGSDGVVVDVLPVFPS
jgi:hypothetical protein